MNLALLIVLMCVVYLGVGLTSAGITTRQILRARGVYDDGYHDTYNRQTKDRAIGLGFFALFFWPILGASVLVCGFVIGFYKLISLAILPEKLREL